MTVERLLADALRGADDYAPSPDLFAKVQRSIGEAAAHQRRIRRALTWAAVGLGVAVVWVAAFLDVSDGMVTDTWWVIEALAVAILVATVVVLGPVIRRFGKGLTLEVFRSNRATSDRFLNLLDIAYYLVFGAYIVMSMTFSPPTDWTGDLASVLEWEALRIGGLLLIMGILHAITIAVLPVMGLIFASNWRRAARAEVGGDTPEPNPRAEKADRVATWIVWFVAVDVAVAAVFIIIPAVIGGILGGE